MAPRPHPSTPTSPPCAAHRRATRQATGSATQGQGTLGPPSGRRGGRPHLAQPVALGERLVGHVLELLRHVAGAPSCGVILDLRRQELRRHAEGGREGRAALSTQQQPRREGLDRKLSYYKYLH